MRNYWTVALLGIVLSAALAWPPRTCGAEPVNGPKTPLDEYVGKADPTYAWKVIKTIPGDGYTTFVVDMQSQRWRSVPEVDRPVWQHWLVIVKPQTVKHDTALLLIGGGRNGSPAPEAPSLQSVRLAKATSSVVGCPRLGGGGPNGPRVLNVEQALVGKGDDSNCLTCASACCAALFFIGLMRLYSASK